MTRTTAQKAQAMFGKHYRAALVELIGISERAICRFEQHNDWPLDIEHLIDDVWQCRAEYQNKRICAEAFGGQWR